MKNKDGSLEVLKESWGTLKLRSSKFSERSYTLCKHESLKSSRNNSNSTKPALRKTSIEIKEAMGPENSIYIKILECLGNLCIYFIRNEVLQDTVNMSKKQEKEYLQAKDVHFVQRAAFFDIIECYVDWLRPSKNKCTYIGPMGSERPSCGGGVEQRRMECFLKTVVNSGPFIFL